MDNESWNNPQVWRATEQLASQMIGADPDGDPPQISGGSNLSDDQRALAFYLARSMARISRMVRDEIEYRRLIN